MKLVILLIFKQTLLHGPFSAYRFRLKGPGYSACIERFRIAKEAFNRQEGKGEPTALSGHEETERAETEHGEKTVQVDREGTKKDCEIKKRVERERLERERV